MELSFLWIRDNKIRLSLTKSLITYILTPWNISSTHSIHFSNSQGPALLSTFLSNPIIISFTLSSFDNVRFSVLLSKRNILDRFENIFKFLVYDSSNACESSYNSNKIFELFLNFSFIHSNFKCAIFIPH